MARCALKRFSGAKYHITNRGNGRCRIFYTDDDRLRFLEQLGAGLEKDNVTLYAYCLMSNHFHLFVETPDANIDQFMGRLGTAFSGRHWGQALRMEFWRVMTAQIYEYDVLPDAAGGADGSESSWTFYEYDTPF